MRKAGEKQSGKSEPCVQVRQGEMGGFSGLALMSLVVRSVQREGATVTKNSFVLTIMLT